MDIRLGLERITAVLDRLGRPQDEMACMHVGGTNGKGSVTAFLAHVLVHNGYRTGWFTSPHLERVEERIRVDGQEILPQQMDRLSQEVAAATEKAGVEPLTEFERLTAIALLHFARQGVQVAVMEVGLGGRLDATNLWARPLVTVVTNVSLDHTDRLGETVPAIAVEKAGIIKPGVGLVTAAEGEALAVLAEAAQACQADVYRADRQVWTPLPDGRLEYRGGRLDGVAVELPLRGLHQWDNAAIAIKALEMSSLPLEKPLVARGLEATQWPGRLERLTCDGVEWLLDGAHNLAGCAALAAELSAETRHPIGLVFGALSDKDGRAMLGRLKPFSDQLFLTSPPSDRAVDPESWGAESEIFAQWQDAVEAAQSWAKTHQGLVVAAGSLYLIGAIRTMLLASTAEPRERVHP